MRRCSTALEGSFRIKMHNYVYQFVEKKFRNYKLNHWYVSYWLCINELHVVDFFLLNANFANKKEFKKIKKINKLYNTWKNIYHIFLNCRNITVWNNIKDTNWNGQPSDHCITIILSSNRTTSLFPCQQALPFMCQYQKGNHLLFNIVD